MADWEIFRNRRDFCPLGHEPRGMGHIPINRRWGLPPKDILISEYCNLWRQPTTWSLVQLSLCLYVDYSKAFSAGGEPNTAGLKVRSSDLEHR